MSLKRCVEDPGSGIRRYPWDEVGHAASLRLTLLFSPAQPAAVHPPHWHPRTGGPWPAAQTFAAALDAAMTTSTGTSSTSGRYAARSPATSIC